MSKFFKGDVTTHEAIVNLPATEIERKLGYAVGRLSRGYDIYELVGHVGPEDFVWGDQTRYSGGWQYQRDAREYARRIDVLRAELGKRYNYNERKVDAELQAKSAAEAAKLNVRTGGRRIIKVKPVTPHDSDPAVHWLTQYPNARPGGIPQWTLIREKAFRLLASIPAGGTPRQ